jgi:hypothetical protein
MEDLLTTEEHKVMASLADLFGSISSMCGSSITRQQDMLEVTMHVHALQRIVLSQAAARAYPEEYRLLGETVETL